MKNKPFWRIALFFSCCLVKVLLVIKIRLKLSSMVSVYLVTLQIEKTTSNMSKSPQFERIVSVCTGLKIA